MNCSSEEDSPQYSWSLAQGLMDKDVTLSADNRTLSVRSDVEIALTCTIKNNMGTASTTQTIPPCPGEQLLAGSSWLKC